MTCSMFNPQKGYCHLASCGNELPKGRRKWCSQECGETYWTNHTWGLARAAVLKRDDYTCQHCGFTSHHTGPPQTSVYEREKYDNWLEVNHIVPRNGRGYASGCAHHQDNLVTLCHKCHAKVTAEQQAEAARVRRRQKIVAWQNLFVVPWPGLERALRRDIPIASDLEEVAKS